MQTNENKQHEPLTENDHTEHQSLNTTTDEIYQEMDGLGEFFMEQMGAIVEEFDQYRADTGAALADLGVTGHNLRVVWGTYVGTGQYGPDHPTRLDFEFYPLLVVVGQETVSQYMPYVFFRGSTRLALSSSTSSTIAWGEKSLSIRSDRDASDQLNSTSRYHYFALGYDL